jgi:hypothetical protein
LAVAQTGIGFAAVIWLTFRLGELDTV